MRRFYVLLSFTLCFLIACQSREQEIYESKPVVESQPIDQLEKREETKSTEDKKMEAIEDNHTESLNLEWQPIKEGIPLILEGVNGEWSLLLLNLSDGQSLEYQSSQQMKAASLIKLFVAGAYLEYLSQHNQSISKEDDTLLSRMLSESDNEATNTLVRQLGGGEFQKGLEKVNEWCLRYGFEKTRMERALGDLTQKELDNYTSAKDVGQLLDMIYTNRLSNTQIGTYLLEKLLLQTRRQKIPSVLPKELLVANKTGELPNVEHDAAIVLGNQPFILVIMSQDISGNGMGIEKIQEMTRMIYENIVREDK